MSLTEALNESPGEKLLGGILFVYEPELFSTLKKGLEVVIVTRHKSRPLLVFVPIIRVA
jgi:hypothetical protein